MPFQKGHKINVGRKLSTKTKLKMSLAHKGKIISEEQKEKLRIANKNNRTGVENGKKTRFKPTGSKGRKLLGKNGYRNIHKWVVKQLGQPTKCEWCGIDGLTGRQIHWANISGKYKRNLNDWERLCVKCHFKKDKNKILK